MTGPTRRRSFALPILAALPARAQEVWPARPIRMIVPFVPGGSTDLLGRLVSQRLSERLGQPVVAENRPGASTNLAGELVARARPDGYMLLFGAAAIAVNPALFASLSYDLFRDFVPISLICRTPLCMVVPKDSAVRDVAGLIAQARSQPEGMIYGSSGSGTIPHVAVEDFATRAGIRLTHVPYRGGAAAMQDLMGGRLPMMMESVPTLLPLIRAGDIRPLAVAEAQPIAVLPGVPPLAEQGFPGFAAAAWNALLVPAGMPRDIVARLESETMEMLLEPETMRRVEALGAIPVGSSAAELDAFLHAEATRWAEVVRRTGATAN